MSLVQSLVSFLKKNDSPKDGEAPDGLCPNCWGRQDYGGKFYDTVKLNNLDVNSPDAELGWINDYANKHLAGIAIKEQDGELSCVACKVAYKSE